MKVTALHMEQFRNIQELTFLPCDGVNVIYGENAQGKTNFLEALWLFTGSRSFRGAKDAELISFDSSHSALSLSFYAQGREQEAEIDLGEKRSARLNGVGLSSVSKLAGNFYAVVFSPSHLSLIKDGPGERRRFIDGALCQIRPKYHAVLGEYQRVLQQRNVLLKDAQHHPELLDTLDIWEDRLAQYAAVITFQREKYIEKLSPFAKDVFAGISGGSEELSLSILHPQPLEGALKEELYRQYLLQLKAARKQDFITGTTSVGPHRDDLLLSINGVSARTFGSQGQQRSCVLALKLSEASLLREFSGEQPVALLDDVMSELDSRRQDYILHHIEGWQVFITCCDETTVSKLKVGRCAQMKQGVLK